MLREQIVESVVLLFKEKEWNWEGTNFATGDTNFTMTENTRIEEEMKDIIWWLKKLHKNNMKNLRAKREEKH